MKVKIYRYKYNNKTYYAEGYDEVNIRLTLENYLQVVPGTLSVGESPDFNTELKLIWDKRNTSHVLTLTKEQTTSRDQLKLYKDKQHCIYELGLLLKEDKAFLNGLQGHIIANEGNQVKFLNCKMVKSNGDEIGHEICYSFQGSSDPDMTDRIYRFRNLASAYKYVRSELVRLELSEGMYNKNFTNLEMCDSFIAGFGNADLFLLDNDISVKTPYKKYENKDFNL